MLQDISMEAVKDAVVVIKKIHSSDNHKKSCITLLQTRPLCDIIVRKKQDAKGGDAGGHGKRFGCGYRCGWSEGAV